MFHPIRALTVAYLRVALLAAVPMLSVAILGPWLMSQIIEIKVGAPVSMTDGNMRPAPWYLNYIVISLFCFVAVPWAALPTLIQKARLCLLPLSNRFLGTFLWLAPACVVMACNAITQVSYHYLFENTWPILTTTLSCGVFSTMLMAGGFWILDFQWRKVLVIIAVVASWSFWFVLRCFPDGLRGTLVPVETFSTTDLVALLLTSAGTWWLTTFAFAKYRCGENQYPERFGQLSWMPFETTADGIAQSIPLASSPMAGLLAMEWKKGRSIAVATATIMLAMIAVISVTTLMSKDASLLGMALMLLTLCSLIAGIVLGMWLGAEIGDNSGNGLKQSYGTLPFSNADLGRALIQTCAKSVMLCWTLIAIALVIIIGVHTALVERVNPWKLYNEALMIQEFGRFAGVSMVAASLLGMWAIAGLGLVLAATGRVWLSIAFIVDVIVLVIVGEILPDLFPSWGLAAARAIPIVLALGVAVCGSLWLLLTASRRHLITARCTALCFLTAVAVCALILAGFNSQPNSAGLYVQIVVASAAFLVVAPVPGLPLALAWNRHR
ncbi:MAG: hypothetical protein R3C59_03680 [Planctomycetaceae bacterium]